MPLPKPKKNEEKSEFMDRCMGNSIMNKEFPEKDQRYKVCESQWNKGDNMGNEVDKKNSVSRIDTVIFPDIDAELEGMEEKFLKTSEGYLKGRAIVTNVGVFSYKLEDGTIQKELRPPEEVLNQDSVKTLALKPLTNEHPKEKVTNENINEYSVGFLGDSVRKDAYHVSIPITISNKQAVQEVEEGKRAISCGYTCDLEDKSGTWMGVDYDKIQRNIRYNHAALVLKGRAGDAVKINIDRADGIMVEDNSQEAIKADENKNKDKKQEDEDMGQKKITIDGVEYLGDADFVKTYQKLNKDNQDLQTKVDKFEKETEQLKKDKEKAEADRDSYKEQLEAKSDEEIEKKVEDRANKKLKIFDVAKRADVEIKDDDKDIDVQKKVIKKMFPNAKLDNASETYIEARFDSATDLVNEAEKSDEDKRIAGADTKEGSKSEFNADEARNRMINRELGKEAENK